MEQPAEADAGLRQKRCLLVLTTAGPEAGQTGQYRRLRGYGQLFKEMGRCPIRVACYSPAAKSPEKLCQEGQEEHEYEHCYRTATRSRTRTLS